MRKVGKSRGGQKIPRVPLARVFNFLKNPRVPLWLSFLSAQGGQPKNRLFSKSFWLRESQDPPVPIHDALFLGFYAIMVQETALFFSLLPLTNARLRLIDCRMVNTVFLYVEQSQLIACPMAQLHKGQ